MLACMDTMANNYTPCLKKVSELRKMEGKEERKEKEYPTLPVCRLWCPVPKQTQTEEGGTEDLERPCMETSDSK
jgi:hypothetical protein